ncbi:hypothetical protein OGH69_03865 [Flavobacterium sp. MFBS3-15]|uniref:hypothetical protein n=1 Tax=Flavobacterium sp. MFBS3-15 TaxID=2989816 RepID=UPI002236B81C|nr:hypothetical protein [Flavobacterium sp. MFBS3-15]MCW4468092.1 hypothetical protein [Flavobacterium sp. MFBS3-15]
MRKILIALTASLFALAGCSSDGDGNGGGSNTQAAVPSFPENNSECTTGVEVSATQSRVTFQWSAAPDTETYFVYVKNLTTQNLLQYSAGGNLSLEVILDKGTPYSWYVNANKSNGSTVRSDIWKFYNAGNGITNYAPFPAEVVAPAMSATVHGPTVTLQWDGSDLDNDIVDYKVYLDTNTNPTTLKGTVTTESLPNVAVVSGGTYYWKVVTTDEAGNVTSSPVYQFKVF